MQNTKSLSQNIQNAKEYIEVKLGFNKTVMDRQQFIINSIIVLVLGFFFDAFSWREYTPYLVVQFAILVIAGFIYIPSLIKRSRAVGWSEVWWVGLIPFINFVYFFALIIKSSKNMNNNDNSPEQINKENKSSKFKTIDRVLFWIGVILVAVGVPNLLDVLSSIFVGSDNPKIQTDLIVALSYVVIGGILFVSKKRKLKKSVSEEAYKQTVKTAYIVIVGLFVLVALSVLVLFS